MKNRPFWVVIACILVIGAMVTHYTKSYVSREPQAVQTTAQETAASAGGEGEAKEPKNAGMLSEGAEPAPAAAGAKAGTEGLPETAGAEETRGAVLRALPAGEAAAGDSAAEQTASETAAAQEEETVRIPASPLEGVAGRAAAHGGAAEDGDFRERLEELDKQISQLRGQEEDSNIYSIKITAESELNLWEGEMNAIYNSLLEVLPKDEGEQLAAEQQEWLKNSSSQALDRLRVKDSAATVRSAGYTSALAALTRERAYELADRYEQQTVPKEAAPKTAGQPEAPKP